MSGSGLRVKMAVPEGQRYSCRQCGWCCRWWKIEVTLEERDHLLVHDWAAESPRLAGVQLFWEHQVPGRPEPTIQTAQLRGRCVFLEDDGLCIIHRVLGEEAKPATCCRFPIIAGFVGCEPVVALDYSCSAVVRNQGKRVEAMEEEASLWLAEAARGVHYQPEPRPLLGDTVQLSWASYLRLEDQLLEIVSATDLTITRRLAAGEAAISPMAGDESVPGCVRPPLGRFAPMIADVETPHSPTTGRGSRSVGYALAVAAQSGRVYLSTLGLTVDLKAASQVGCDVDSPEFDDHITRFLSNYIGSKSLLKSATIRDGWAYLRVCVELIHWYAAASAAASGKTMADVEDVTTGIQVVGKAFAL